MHHRPGRSFPQFKVIPSAPKIAKPSAVCLRMEVIWDFSEKNFHFLLWRNHRALEKADDSKKL